MLYNKVVELKRQAAAEEEKKNVNKNVQDRHTTQKKFRICVESQNKQHSAKSETSNVYVCII